MNPQEPSAHRLVKPISSLPPRERGNVSSMTQSPHTVPIRYTIHRPAERGNESSRAQRSQTSQIYLVASPQGAGKCIIKDPELPHLF